MNSLSWMIYAIGAADNFSTMVRIVMVLCIGAGIGIAIQFGVRWPTYSWEDSSAENKALIISQTKSLSKWVASVFLICAFVSVIVPDRRTLLLIAGSEIGERVVSSDQVKGIVNPGVDLLKSWILDETNKLQKKKAS